MALSRRIQDILSNFLVQVAYFGDIPNALTIIGTVIISTCVILSGIRKMFRARFQESKALRILLCLEKSS